LKALDAPQAVSDRYSGSLSASRRVASAAAASRSASRSRRCIGRVELLAEGTVHRIVDRSRQEDARRLEVCGSKLRHIHESPRPVSPPFTCATRGGSPVTAGAS